MKNKLRKPNGQRMWAVRAGIRGNAHLWFLEREAIGLSDPGLGDLRKISPDRQSFYAAYRSLRPHETPTGISGIGGKFFRFIHEFDIGDLVVYPCRVDGLIYVGRVDGAYTYSNDRNEVLPHQRSVRWLCNFPKSRLSRKAQQELGAARTLFEIKHHSEEIGLMVSQLITADGSHKNDG